MGYDTLNEQCRRILADGSSWAYGYDSRSQLSSAVKSLPGVPDESFGYLYDDIGNRTSSTEGTSTGSVFRSARSIPVFSVLPNRSIPSTASSIPSAPNPTHPQNRR